MEGVDALRSVGLDRRGELGGQGRVDLDGGHAPGDGQKWKGERAEPRTDLEHVVVRADPGEAHDAAHRVRVDDEVLPPLLRGPDRQAVRQLADMDRPEGGRALQGGRRLLRGSSALDLAHAIVVGRHHGP